MPSSSLQPQQFGSWLHEPFLARASEPGAEFGRHALGAFLTLRLADRFRPEEEPAHPLALAYQIRATRDYLKDLEPQNSEAAHLLEIVRLADAVHRGGARSMLEPPLLAYAHWLEQQLQMEEALDAVETALGLADPASRTEGVAALLQRGRVLRHLGRLDEAQVSYEAGRKKAVAAGDTHSALLGRIGNAIVMRQLGDLAESERALRGILGDAKRLRDRDAMARAHHDLGAVYNDKGQGLQAIPHLYRAFELYPDTTNRVRALSDVGEALKREGLYEAARDAFVIALKTGGTKQVHAVTMIALLELSALTGDRLSFARWKRGIGALAKDLPAERLADFHLQAGRGHAAFGQLKHAAASLGKALAVSEEHHFAEHALHAKAELDAIKMTAARDETSDTSQRRATEREKGPVADVVSKLRALRMAS